MKSSPARRIALWIGMAVVFWLAGRSALTLAREPCVGVADNLDYWRVARPAGIQVPSQRQQGFYVVCSYPVADAQPLSPFSTPALVAWLVRVPIRQGETFDLRHVGMIYWLGSVLILVTGLLRRISPLLVGMVAWVLYDPGYFLFFNSLYADPALVIGLLAVLMILLLDPPIGSTRSNGRVAFGRSLCLVVAVALAGFSKMQYAVFPGIVLFSCLVALALRRSLPKRREQSLLLLLLLLAVLAPLHFLYGPAPRFLDANNFNAVFGGIAKVSSDPRAAMRALGIPAEELERQPSDFFSASRDVTGLALPYLRELSRMRLAALYLSDPGALFRTAEGIHSQLAKVRTHPRGNYTRPESGGRARSYVSAEQFSLWRSRLLNRLPLWSHLFVGTILFFLICRAAGGRWDGRDTTFLFLVLWYGSQCVIAVLGDGLVNLHQHLLGARLALDLLLALTAGRVVLSMLHFVALRRRAMEPRRQPAHAQ